MCGNTNWVSFPQFVGPREVRKLKDRTFTSSKKNVIRIDQLFACK